MTNRVHIHLNECYFCVTCEVFTNCNDSCPGCAGKTFLTVQNIWDRKTEPWEAAPGYPPPCFAGPAGAYELKLRKEAGR